MNSIHRDGEIITRVLKRFGIAAVRGSSSRGWVSGLKGLIEAYRLGLRPHRCSGWPPWTLPAG